MSARINFCPVRDLLSSLRLDRSNQQIMNKVAKVAKKALEVLVFFASCKLTMVEANDLRDCWDMCSLVRENPNFLPNCNRICARALSCE